MTPGEMRELAKNPATEFDWRAQAEWRIGAEVCERLDALLAQNARLVAALGDPVPAGGEGTRKRG